jgi:hypothetical protein
MLFCFLYLFMIYKCLFHMLMLIYVTFEVLMVTSMKMVIFWDVALCSLVDIDQRFTGAYSLCHQGDE